MAGEEGPFKLRTTADRPGLKEAACTTKTEATASVSAGEEPTNAAAVAVISDSKGGNHIVAPHAVPGESAAPAPVTTATFYNGIDLDDLYAYRRPALMRKRQPFSGHSSRRNLPEPDPYCYTDTLQWRLETTYSDGF